MGKDTWLFKFEVMLSSAATIVWPLTHCSGLYCLHRTWTPQARAAQVQMDPNFPATRHHQHRITTSKRKGSRCCLMVRLSRIHIHGCISNNFQLWKHNCWIKQVMCFLINYFKVSRICSGRFQCTSQGFHFKFMYLKNIITILPTPWKVMESNIFIEC